MMTMDVFTDFYEQLVASLPMKDAIFRAKLTQKGLMHSELKATVNSMPTEIQGAQLFLNSIVKALSIGYTESFEKLLLVMEEFRCASLQKLARGIRKRLMEGDRGSDGSGERLYGGVSTDHSDCAVAKKIIINQRSSLVTLHILPLVPSLLANNVINMDEKRKIEMKEKDELERMSYFLNQVILPSLQENKMDKYKGFLVTMAKHDDSLYQEIARKLEIPQSEHSADMHPTPSPQFPLLTEKVTMKIEESSCVQAFISSDDTVKLIEEENLLVTCTNSTYAIQGSWSSVEKFRKHLKGKMKSQHRTLSNPLDKQQCHSSGELSTRHAQSIEGVPEDSSGGIVVQASNLNKENENIKNKCLTTNTELEKHAISVGNVHQAYTAVDEYKNTFNGTQIMDDSNEQPAQTIRPSTNSSISTALAFIDLPKISRRVTIKLGNIVDEDVDAIVNPANAQLIHGAGVAADIDRASNGEVQKASTKLISQHGMLTAGNAVVTGAGGMLKCNMIIHAVGPTEYQHKEKCAPLLQIAYNNAMIMAERFGHKSVSFSPITSGIYGELTANVMLSTLCSYQCHNPTLLTDVRIIITDDPTYGVFLDVLQRERQHLESLLDHPPVPSVITTSSTTSYHSQPYYYPGAFAHFPPPGNAQRWVDGAQFITPVNHHVVTQQPTMSMGSNHLSSAIPAYPNTNLVGPLPVTSTFSHTPLLHTPQSYSCAAVQEPSMLTTVQNAMSTSSATPVANSMSATFNNNPFGRPNGPSNVCRENGRDATGCQQQMRSPTTTVLPNNSVPPSVNDKKFKGNSSKVAMQKLRRHCDALTKLSITSILGSLFAEGVITRYDKMLIETKSLESDRVTYLLDDVLYRSLLVGVMDKYTGFVKVLEQKGEEEYDMVMEKLANSLAL
ncbi:uncharacterized protein [Dysidea avara]|uniref:uncharacterized protein isoform X2 n=1 Tax=Dysidea avara TaxID=196820 RepID=UPI003324CD85